MLSKDYLERGLVGMARASDAHWVEGHHGGALIAAYYFCKENDLPDATVNVIREETDTLVEHHRELFRPLPASEPSSLQPIIAGIDTNIAYSCSIGHNVIFAALALKALGDLPGLATAEVTQRIRTVVESFTVGPRDDNAKKILGVDFSEIHLEPNDDIPTYTDPEQMADFVFREFIRFQRIYRKSSLTYAGHLLTHAQSLVSLLDLGYTDLARKGFDTHRLQVKFTRHFYDLDAPDLTRLAREERDWTKPEYWKQDLASNDWATGHYFKYAYHFSDLLKRVDDLPLKKKVLHQMGYLMATFE